MKTHPLKTRNQKKKFDKLQKQKKPIQTIQIERVVRNISEYQLTEEETTGFNFEIVPKTIPSEAIITNVEASLVDKSLEGAEGIRQDVSRIIKHSKVPKPNLKK